MLIEHRIQADFTDRPFSVKRCDTTWVQSVIQLRTKIHGTVLIGNDFVYTCFKEFCCITERLNVSRVESVLGFLKGVIWAWAGVCFLQDKNISL